MTATRVIPEGGRGWGICAASFSVQFVVMGIHNSFGILYTKLLEVFLKSKAETAWVGSVSVGVMYLFGPITSGLCERLGCKKVAFIGGILSMLGLISTSFVTDLSTIYFTYGILWGIGSSFCYFPTLTATGEYFCERLSLVNGIVTAGSGLGTLTVGPLLQYCLGEYSLATSLRLLSAFAAVLLVAPFTYKPFRSPLIDILDIERTPAAFIDFRVWKNKAFLAYTIAVLVFTLGYSIPLIHLVNHVERLGVPPARAAMLVGFMAVASTISRLVFGRFSDHPRANRLYLTQLAIMGFGITTTILPLVRQYEAFVAAVVMLGLFEGLYVVLIAVLNTDIVGVGQLPRALGGLYGVISLSIIVGPPAAGYIYDQLHSYNAAFYISGGTMTLAVCLLFLVPWLLPDGGAFRRDSGNSRVQSFLQSPRSVRSRNSSVKSRAHSSGTSVADLSSLNLSTSTLDTSFNTTYNSSMSQRGSATRAMIIQQLSSVKAENTEERTEEPDSAIIGLQGADAAPLVKQLQRLALSRNIDEEIHETVV